MLSRVLDATASEFGIQQDSEDYDWLRHHLFVLFDSVKDEAQLRVLLHRAGRVFTALKRRRQPHSPTRH